MNIITAEEINEKIKKPIEYINSCETAFDAKIGELVNYIRKKDIKFVFISGPSASGKTTLTKKLKENLKNSFSISLDDYFKTFDYMPKKKSGEMNFESVFSIDLKKLKSDLRLLKNGGTIYPPQLDFMDMSRKPSPVGYSLANGKICIIEGLHALNSKISGLFLEKSLKIFISPMTGLKAENRLISVYDIRFIRRVVRDSFFRNAGAQINLKMWPDVRAGEKIYTPGYRKNADFLIDTFIPYEICVLKPHIERELLRIEPTKKTKRILSMVSAFEAADDRLIPESSLLREFIK